MIVGLICCCLSCKYRSYPKNYSHCPSFLEFNNLKPDDSALFFKIQWLHMSVRSFRISSKTQPLVQAYIKEDIKVPLHWICVRGIHRRPVNSPHKWPVTRKMLPFDDVTTCILYAMYSRGKLIHNIWTILSTFLVRRYCYMSHIRAHYICTIQFAIYIFYMIHVLIYESYICFIISMISEQLFTHVLLMKIMRWITLSIIDFI